MDIKTTITGTESFMMQAGRAKLRLTFNHFCVSSLDASTISREIEDKESDFFYFPYAFEPGVSQDSGKDWCVRYSREGNFLHVEVLQNNFYCGEATPRLNSALSNKCNDDYSKH